MGGGESGIVVNVVTTHLVAGVDEVVVGGDGGGRQLVRTAKGAAHHTRLCRRARACTHIKLSMQVR